MRDPLHTCWVLTSPVGGTGVTTMTLTLGSLLALQGARVLLVDPCPRHGLSLLIGDARPHSPLEVGSLVAPDVVRGAIFASDFERLSVLPLAMAMGEPSSTWVSTVVHALAWLRNDFDALLVDASGLEASHLDPWLEAADVALVVQTVEPLAIRQLAPLLEHLAMRREARGGLPVFLGVVLNRVRPDAPMFELMFGELQRTYGVLLRRTVIPDDPWVIESALRAMPVPELLPESAGALAASRLLTEILATMKKAAGYAPPPGRLRA